MTCGYNLLNAKNNNFMVSDIRQKTFKGKSPASAAMQIWSTSNLFF